MGSIAQRMTKEAVAALRAHHAKSTKIIGFRVEAYMWGYRGTLLGATWGLHKGLGCMKTLPGLT